MSVKSLILSAFALCLAACATAPAPALVEAPAADFVRSEYKLGVSDKLRMIVFDEPTLTGEYVVSPTGHLVLPLIGEVLAADQSVVSLKQTIEGKYRAGYLREPNVTLEVLTFRPYYILGEVTRPNEYPYTPDLTVAKAVATAGGFTYRANTTRVLIRHANENDEKAYPLNSTLPVHPGDTIRIVERLF